MLAVPAAPTPTVASPAAAAGVTAALSGGLVAAAAAGGVAAMVMVVLAAQLAAVAWWQRLVAPAHRSGTIAVGVGVAIAGDLLVATREGSSISPVAGTLGVAFVVALSVQLARRDGRDGLTASLASSVAAAGLVACGACLIGLREGRGGASSAVVVGASLAVALVVTRLVDLVLPQPAAVPGVRRGVGGLVLGLGAGIGVALAIGGPAGTITARQAALLGLAVVGVALVADLAVSIALSRPEASSTGAPAYLSAQFGPLLALLLASPLGYVVSRVLLG